MTEEFIVNNDKLEFKTIVLEHLKNILNITCKIGEYEGKVSCYIDAVESLADCLLPFFDEEMEKAYKSYNAEIEKEENNNSVRKLKKVGRDLFRETNKLMGRKDYLKGTIYSDDDLD